ncbi:MAG TPA: hypothetical protein VI168_01690 [Croceibacterium sp.]
MSNPTDGGSGLFDTIVKLVNVGFAGVGVVVLLLVFIILFQGKPADAGARKLHNRFLTWGMSFAFFCGALSVVTPLLAPKPEPTVAPGRPAEMLLSFSPRFETEGLTNPSITLPDGKVVTPGTRFETQGGQVLVSVDEALQDVAQLRQTAVTLAETATAAQRQADSAVAALASSQDRPPSAPVAAAQQQAQEASQESQEATAAISDAIRTGNYQILRTKNRTLTDATRQSITARSRVIAAGR